MPTACGAVLYRAMPHSRKSPCYARSGLSGTAEWLLKSLRLASSGGQENLLSQDSHFYGEEGMLENSVNFQSSWPREHEEKKKKKNPQPAGYLPRAQKQPPLHHLPFISSRSDRNTLLAEYGFPQYCPSHRYRGPKGKLNFKHT